MKILESVLHRQEQKEIDQILINIRNGRRDDGNYILSFAEQKRIGYFLLRAHCLIDEVSQYEEMDRNIIETINYYKKMKKILVLTIIILSLFRVLEFFINR